MKRNVIRRKISEPRSGHDAEPRDGSVQSVDRALQIIETLAEDDEGYLLSDLAVRTGLSTSTAHRLLTTLEKRRFGQFDRTQSKWHVGARSFTVGATFARRNFAAQVVPYLRKLRDLKRETANLAVVDDEVIVVLTRMESREKGGARHLFRRGRERDRPPSWHAAIDGEVDRAAGRSVQGIGGDPAPRLRRIVLILRAAGSKKTT